jgi:hypothetical protein
MIAAKGDYNEKICSHYCVISLNASLSGFWKDKRYRDEN